MIHHRSVSDLLGTGGGSHKTASSWLFGLVALASAPGTEPELH